MKRVFIGGLYNGIQEEDIRNRFSQFGEIHGVEIKRKKTETDSDEKTFAYLDINITDENLKKCFNIYSRFKWKGSELKLQLAKEDFLKKLSKERENGFVIPPKVRPGKGSHHDPLKHLPKAQNYEIKGAVPGTPIPGEENWVVGKYGRVMPIVHIHRQGQRKKTIILNKANNIKVDPSKFCHHLKKIKDVDELPEQQSGNLTWELEADDREIVCKRKGEFLSKKKAKEKYTMSKIKNGTITNGNKKDQETESSNDRELKVVSSTGRVKGKESKQVLHNDLTCQLSNKSNNKAKQQGKNSGNKNKEKLKEVNSSVEKTVVDVNDKGKSMMDSKVGVVSFTEDELSDNDSVSSAGTDEIISKKQKLNTEHKSSNSNKIMIHYAFGVDEYASGFSSKYEEVDNSENFVYDSDDSLTEVGYQRLAKRIEDEYRKKSETSSQTGNTQGSNRNEVEFLTNQLHTKTNICQLNKRNGKVNNSENLQKVSEKKAHCVSDFNSEMSAEESDIESLSYSLNSKSSSCLANNNENISSENSSDSENTEDSCDRSDIFYEVPGKNKNKSKFVIPPFRGTAGLYSPKDFAAPGSSKVESSRNDSELLGFGCFQESTEVSSSQKMAVKLDKGKSSADDSESSSSDSELSDSESSSSGEEDTLSIKTDEVCKDAKQSTDAENIRQSTKSDNDSVEKGAVKLQHETLSVESNDVPNQSTTESVQDQSERKRVESLIQRSKESEQKKSAIQKALSMEANVKMPNKKIVFDTEDTESSETDGEVKKGTDIPPQQKKDMERKPTLFDSSSEESSDDEDDNRFRIRPEFEGKAGKKLMKLQSRFQNDERFKMDERFVESSDEEEEDADLETELKPKEEKDDEKSRALKILSEVVGSSAIKKLQKGKQMFRDVSALHFDPTREDHSQFEVKVPQKDKKTKESSTKETKKSKEVVDKEEEVIENTIPKVSKDKFYEVSTSFKDVFSNKSSDADVSSTGFSLLSAFGKGQVDSDEDMEDAHQKAIPLKESGGNFLWGQDNDSSGDEMSDEEQDRKHEKVNVFSRTQSTFFFSEDDPRIKEAIQEFYRKEDLEIIREKWLEKRPHLVNSYRSKHKSLVRKKRLAEKQKRTKSKVKS